ncbi:MAG: hypothetical protein AMJ90_03845 [candidate division Zixibacteria bacterium SM23_73_2]|nr:MAG: hypothetical protein AMJ90_03845 [candidate division Zixibacteria bacterium SM23_73_2]
MIIFSKNKLKELAKLKTKKGRKEQKRFLVEGKRFCEELFNSSHKAELILYTLSFSKSKDGGKLLDDFGKKKVEIVQVKNEDIKKLSDTVMSQGIVAIAQMKIFSLDEGFLKNKKFVLALDSIKEPGNSGTILRTADTAGVDCVFFSKDCVELHNPKVLRSTMGSIFHLPIIEEVNLENVLPLLKKNGFKIYAADVKEGKFYDQIDYSSKACLIIGSESEGISKEILSLADERVRIPIYGKAESLNAAVACGIILYQMAGNIKDQ